MEAAKRAKFAVPADTAAQTDGPAWAEVEAGADAASRAALADTAACADGPAWLAIGVDTDVAAFAVTLALAEHADRTANADRSDAPGIVVGAVVSAPAHAAVDAADPERATCPEYAGALVAAADVVVAAGATAAAFALCAVRSGLPVTATLASPVQCDYSGPPDAATPKGAGPPEGRAARPQNEDREAPSWASIARIPCSRGGQAARRTRSRACRARHASSTASGGTCAEALAGPFSSHARVALRFSSIPKRDGGTSVVHDNDDSDGARFRDR